MESASDRQVDVTDHKQSDLHSPSYPHKESSVIDIGDDKNNGHDIQHYIQEITEMIAFLDYSFERAFTIKEKSYIRAYKDHVMTI